MATVNRHNEEVHTWSEAGLDLCYVDQGSGPLLLCIHGVPGDMGDFRPLERALDGRFRVMRVDLPGFGASPPTPRVRSLAAVASLLARFAAGLPSPPLVLGYSFGGAVALRVAAQCQGKLRGLALLSPVGLRPHSLLRSSPMGLVSMALKVPLVRSLLAGPLRRAHTRVGLGEGTSDATLATGVHYAASVGFAAQAQAAAELTLPTLVAWTERDRIVEPDICRELADALPDGPRICLPDGDHAALVRSPGPVAEALRSWAAATS